MSVDSRSDCATHGQSRSFAFPVTDEPIINKTPPDILSGSVVTIQLFLTQTTYIRYHHTRRGYILETCMQEAL
ncbi:MAG: hypothetical protein J07HQX50_01397 [Haloquadratum sp. J07HQX50]|nr:MAG: hypothetical protein J07HQX50_01397 [Haloquadratum sp. J07HQX50]